MPQNAYLTKEEERKLIRRGQHGCVESRNRVIMNIYHLIEGEVTKLLLKRFYMPDHIDDAINFVVSVLIEKFHKFELKRNLRYSTYSHFWVRQAARRYVDRRFLIHIPSHQLHPTKYKKNMQTLYTWPEYVKARGSLGEGRGKYKRNCSVGRSRDSFDEADGDEFDE